MAQQHGGPRGDVTTLKDVGKADTSLDYFSGTGKRLDQARENLTAVEEFELQNSKERVQRARDRKKQHQRTMGKMPGFDEDSDQFMDNAFGSGEESNDDNDEQDARPNPEPAPAPDRSKDKELTELITQYLDPDCSERERKSLGKSIQATVRGLDDAGRHVGFTLMQGLLEEARVCSGSLG